MKNIPSLQTFLSSKPLYYKEIDHKRVHTAYDTLKPHIKRPTTIHIVGTNGKGSTGRMIAHLALKGASVGRGVPTPTMGDDDHQRHQRGQVIHDSSLRDKSQITRSLRVGHYTSPHILRFNERIWLDGEDASDEVLERAHERLYGILGVDTSEGLSYFEYTTLLAFVVFEDCDLMVLEAGLGGEYDATNVCDKELSVITPIGIDHQAFLGETIEEIAATKIRSIQSKALLAPQLYPEVVEVAKKIASEVGAELFFGEQLAVSSEQRADSSEELGIRNEELRDSVGRGVPTPTNNGNDRGQGLGFRVQEASFGKAQEPHQRGQVIHDSSLRDKSQITRPQTTHYPLPTTLYKKGWPDYLIQNAMVAMQALDILGIPYDPADLNDLELFGRFYPLRDNIRIDVGHNPLAARAIEEAMEPETVLIYNSLDDKDYKEVLRTLKPKVSRVEIIRIDSQRAATLESIEQALGKVGLPYSYFDGDIDPDEHYLVFGSFYVVEEFLKIFDFQN